MDSDWVLLSRETRRKFATATWVPLRASQQQNSGEITQVGFTSDVFACGSVAFPPEHRDRADKLGWSDIGIGHNVLPYAYDDGDYSPIDQYQYNDKEPLGVELVFEHPQPVVGGRKWILNPDLVVALRLIKDRENWIRPEEDFTVVVREHLDSDDNHCLIEIRREYLSDYLAARNMNLRLSYYFQRVRNITDEEANSISLNETRGNRDGGEFSLSMRTLEAVFGGEWAVFRAWRTDVDDEEDAPVMGQESNDNTASESSRGRRTGYTGVRVEGEFWRDEWIEHGGTSVRVRGDQETDLPSYVVETDGKRMPSVELNHEEVGRWLWFRPSVVTELLSHRGFSLEWFTADTAGLGSTSGYRTHIGLNSSDLVSVYAHDIARLPGWEQRIWSGHNVAPDGKVSKELLDAQVRADPASTVAVEAKLLRTLDSLQTGFREVLGVDLFTHDLNAETFAHQVSRFAVSDRQSLLRLAKELVRVFTDRLNVTALRTIATRSDKDKLGSNKLLESIVADKIGADQARKIFGPIVGTYDMRIGDAHPTSSKIEEAIALAGIDETRSFLRQGEQLIHNFGCSTYWIGRVLLGDSE